MRNEITFEIREHIGVLSEQSNGWKKEVNVVAWNGNEPKIDIRSWDETHEKMSRGITLTEQEARDLMLALVDHYGFDTASD